MEQQESKSFNFEQQLTFAILRMLRGLFNSLEFFITAIKDHDNEDNL